MRWFQLEAVLAVTGWAFTSSATHVGVPRDALHGECLEENNDVGKLGKKLSPSAKIYFPGSAEFETASTRWSVLQPPKVNMVVVPGTARDVVETVSFGFNLACFI